MDTPIARPPVRTKLGPDACTIRRVEVRTCVQRQLAPGWRFARGSIPEVHGWLVTLVSQAGVRGEGHVLATPLAAPDAARARRVIGEVSPALIGADASQLEELHAVVSEAAAGDACVAAGFVAALYELAARSAGVPLHRLLGTALRDTIATVRLIPIAAPEAMAAQARALVQRGWRALKLKLDGSADDDVARVRAVRAEVGPAVRLAVDANQAYAADDAIDVCRALLPHGVAVMEQPVPAADRDALKRVSDAAPMPVEADEAIGSLAGLAELIEMRAAGSYNLKIHYLGGLHNALAALRLCEAASVPCRLGAVFAPRLAAAQAAHLAAVARALHGGAEIAEFDHLLDDPYGGYEPRDGAVPVPPGAGSGIAPLAPRAEDEAGLDKETP
jgi:L-alanine-DL-glutamate epimerase-like enolase superfamily enzyme